jgi:hypothetical protein
MKSINKEKFIKISDNAFNQLIDIFILDLNNHLDIKKLDPALQSKCEKISGKSFGAFNKVSFNFIYNDQDRCIATLKDSEYPQIYIFNEDFILLTTNKTSCLQLVFYLKENYNHRNYIGQLNLSLFFGFLQSNFFDFK